MRHLTLFALQILCLSVMHVAFSQPRLLDPLDSLDGWKLIVSDGVTGTLTLAPGIKDSALAIGYDFQGGSGYVIAQKQFSLHLSSDYRFTFFLRGEGPVNNFEFKLLDTADNVFWLKLPDYEFPPDWKRRTIKRRQISFAWGPAHGGEIRHVDRIEFVVSAGTGGGQGRVVIDEFSYEPIVESDARVSPVVRTSSGAPPALAPGSVDSIQRWTPLGRDGEWMTVDFGRRRDLGGLVLQWEPQAHAADYDIDILDDSAAWTPAARVRGGNGGRDYVYLPDTEARAIRLRLRRPAGSAYVLNALTVKGPAFGADANALYRTIAADAPRGWFPKYFGQVQSYWTIVGVAGDDREALLNEEGMIEVDRASFSVEPFLVAEGRLMTWADMTCDQSLEDGYLPIPRVRRTGGGMILEITAFAAGAPGSSVLFATYRLSNTGSRPLSGSLYLAVRPFQVNPPSQWLNLRGGTASITEMALTGGVVHVNATKRLVLLDRPARFGATSFGGGDIVEYLAGDTLPAQQSVHEPLGFASGALGYDFALEPGKEQLVALAIPFHGAAPALPTNLTPQEAARLVSSHHERTREFWHAKLNRVSWHLPPAAQQVEQTLKSNLAYVLINRDGPAIQPGSRSYERAWIRDGSLTSSALLRLGITDEVREYLDWYSGYQYPSGKIPCVVDARGADPVPEHDSHGEYIYALMEYFRFTQDTAWLRGKRDRVRAAVRYIQDLRSQRKTELYRSGTPIQRACYGLVPESISHEGYSDKPMHSYWDNFFTLRGLKDAASMERILGDGAAAVAVARERDDLRTDLYASLRETMEIHGVDYLPGCVELGDFDPTSTTIAVYPCGELEWLPEPALHNTFERYFHFFVDRRDGRVAWRNYTPYEIRIVGTFVYLGEKQRAHALLDFFMRDRRPPGWNQWAEVVWHDRQAAEFIGDMPHTWVGSDYIRAVRSMFAYERESDTTLVLGAGISESWLSGTDRIGVEGLPTFYGSLTYYMQRSAAGISVDVSGALRMPSGGVEVRSPLDQPGSGALVDGVATALEPEGGVRLRKVPAHVVFLP